MNSKQHRDVPSRKHRRKSRVPMIICLIILLAAVVLIIGYLLIAGKLGKINRVNKEDEVAIARSEQTFEVDEGAAEEDTLAPEDVAWTTVTPSAEEEDAQRVYNLLLIGQDRRAGESRTRSDTMIICSINKDTKKITLASLMRDMYVPIEGYDDNRINAAYPFGGMTLLDKVIENDFGVHIDGNIEVDFDGFMTAMSYIGNLDIELYEAEAQYINIEVPTATAYAGMNSLNPEQLLSYARMRKVGHADYERTERQRRVLTAAFQKLSQSDPATVLNMMDYIFPCLTTDMSNKEILELATMIISEGVSLNSESYRIPVDNTYTSQSIRGMSVLVPDLQANADALHTYLYGEEDTGVTKPSAGTSDGTETYGTSSQGE